MIMRKLILVPAGIALLAVGYVTLLPPFGAQAENKCDGIPDNVKKLECIVREDQRKNPPKPFDIDNPTDEQKNQVSETIARNNLNCPRVAKLTKEGENAHGWVVRISCSSEHGEHKWDIRMTGYPVSVPTFAPW